jgi:cytochrome c oxidase subunit 4
MQEKISFSFQNILFVYLGLLILLALTIAASFYHLGSWSWVVGLGIAGAKATLVGLYFMKLRIESPRIRLLAIAGLLWVGLLLAFIFSDYLTRFSFGVLGK